MKFSQMHIRNILRKMHYIINICRAKIFIFISMLLVLSFAGCEDQTPTPIPFSKGIGYLGDLNNLDIHMLDDEKKELSVMNFKGNVLIVLFSTIWCPNCPEVLKMFEKLQGKLEVENIKSVKIILLNIGEEDVADAKYHYAKIGIKDLKVYRLLQSKINCVSGIPACIIFGKDGDPVCGYIGGGRDFCSEIFFNYIKYLSKK